MRHRCLNFLEEPLIELFALTGRVALVSGSSRGIGRAIARGLAASGATVVLNGRQADVLDATATELAAELAGDPAGRPAGTSGASFDVQAFDVTDPDAVRAGVAAVLERHAAIDVLVNNVGIQHRAPITAFSDADWDRLVAANLSSAFYLSRAVAPAMIARRAGKIVMLCSLQSDLGRAGIAPYAATKGGLRMLTRGLCADLGPSNIQVNGIAPGYIETELTAPLAADPEFSGWVERRTPAGRWGRVDDLIGAAVFFASSASDFVNGQVLFVDGGITAVV